MLSETKTIRRWKCLCAYDGTTFAGWQSQAPSTRSTSSGQAGSGQAARRAIQDVVEARLAEILKTPVRIHGSGRTDSGVHAHGQVFHFDAAWPHATPKLLAAFRVGLPAAIQIKSVRPVAAGFHARFDATGKRYDYYIHLGDADPFTRPYCWTFFKPLDHAAMLAAADVLQGRHDFRAFTALNGPEPDDTVRDLRRSRWRAADAASTSRPRRMGFSTRWCAAWSHAGCRGGGQALGRGCPPHPAFALRAGRPCKPRRRRDCFDQGVFLLIDGIHRIRSNDENEIREGGAR